ncbi:MAG: glycoside hydrolase family 88 protein, partial [Planctomycetaceae bacterium]|nr:glycoside hydrolase family 88 protein [Planctomycetaceae bacterium]
AVFCWLCMLSPLMADDVLEQAIQSWKGDVLTIGRDDRGEPLRVLIDPEAWEYHADEIRYFTLIDVGDDPTEVRDATAIFKQNQEAPQIDSGIRKVRAYLFVTPVMVPGKQGRERLLEFSSQGSAYNTPGEVTMATVLRFAAWFGPDLVMEVHSSQLAEYQDFLRAYSADNSLSPEWKPGSLANEIQSDLLGLGAPRVGRAAPLGAAYDDREKITAMRQWGMMHPWKKKDGSGGTRYVPSQPRIEIQRRIDRTPEQVADELLSVYGDQLNSVMYQPALAVLSRQRWAISRHDDEQLQQVQGILNPYLSGDKEPLKGLGNGSQYAGHLAFAEWARHSGDAAAIKLVQAAADRGFDDQGQPLEAMPTHNEMSDAVFMACPILTAAAELTGEQKYLDMAGQHFRFMRKLCQREDGIYRHSPLCEAPWGRGNGFPALGLALSLTDLDSILANADRAALHPVARELRTEFRDALEQHLSALLEHQDVTGMWRQVIDDPRAYREMTSTCMIGFALQRSLDRGWLTDEKYKTAVDRAWQAVKVRTGAHGELMDVCTGTGKQKTLDDYLNRTAIWGKDERGGAMALMFATERELTERE